MLSGDVKISVKSKPIAHQLTLPTPQDTPLSKLSREPRHSRQHARADTLLK